MAADFVSALAAEIDGLESQLAADPRYAKLRELKRVQALYSAPAVNPPPRVRPTQPTSGRSPSPERQAILDMAKTFMGDQSEPTPTSDLYELLTAAGVQIPGTSPKNNLSAMLSNSPEFRSHGRSGWTIASRTPEATGDLLSGSAPAASMSSPASPAGEPSSVRPVDPVPGGGT